MTRDLLFIEDEFAGAAGGDPCPSGGLHVYDVTGPLEAAPVKLGYWNIADLRYPTAERPARPLHDARLPDPPG